MTARKFTVFVQLAMILAGAALAQARRQPSDQNQQNPPAPAVVEAPKVLPGAPGTPGPDTTGVAVDPKTYVIGPEDILYIRVWREPDFSGPEGVRPDGKITLPLIGDVQAAGLTPERLAAQLDQALGTYLTKPDVIVTVAQVNSKKYFIQGEVNHSGQFPLIGPITIFEALSNASGFRDFADKKHIVIIRGDQRLTFNWTDYVKSKGKGKAQDQNIQLQNGDTIVVK